MRKVNQLGEVKCGLFDLLNGQLPRCSSIKWAFDRCSFPHDQWCHGSPPAFIVCPKAQSAMNCRHLPFWSMLSRPTVGTLVNTVPWPDSPRKRSSILFLIVPSGPSTIVLFTGGYRAYDEKYHQVGTKQLVTTGPIRRQVQPGYTTCASLQTLTQKGQGRAFQHVLSVMQRSSPLHMSQSSCLGSTSQPTPGPEWVISLKCIYCVRGKGG